MGQPLGKRQIEIAELLLKRPYDAEELVQRLYKKPPTKTLRNIVWSSLRGMEERRMISYVGRTFAGGRRWELTKQGRKDLENFKSQTNVHQLQPNGK